MHSTPSDQPKLTRKHRLLLRVERFSRGHYKFVFLLAALALIGGTYLGSRLKLESDLLALIPEGNRQVDTFRQALQDFGSVDYLLALVEAGPDRGADDIEDFADLFAEQLRGLQDLVEVVDYRFELDDDFVELFYANALLFLPPDQLEGLGERLSDDAIQAQVRQIRMNMASPTATFTQDLMQSDPLNLMPLFLNRLRRNRGELQVDLTDGYYLSQDQQALIMLIKPTGSSQNLKFDRQLLKAVRDAEQRVTDQLVEEFDVAPEELGISIRYGGNYAIAVDEAGLIQRDVTFNLFFSLFAVSALYWLCYRRFAALLYSSIPLLVGQALTFALAFFVLGGLNAASSAFTALLMGLGTDFVIVIYARYVEERRKGKSLAEATELMIGETGLGVFTGAITSAGTFYAMCYSQFRGLKDLGFLIGSGILLCALVIVFLLPAMIKWNEGVRRRKVDSVKKLHLQSFGLERLIPFAARHRTLVVVGLGALAVVAAFMATRLEFDDTVRVLRSGNSPAYRVQLEVGQKFGATLSYMMAIAEAPTTAEAVALTERIEERLQPFIEDETISTSDSILTYLPPEAQQREILEAVATDHSRAFDPQRVRATFLDALDRNNLRQDPFDEFLTRMDGFLAPEEPVRLGDLEAQGLGRLLERYIRTDEGGTRIVTYLFLTDPRWKRNPPPGLTEALTLGDDGIVVTGTNIVGAEFRRIFSREAPRAVMLGLIVVFALLWIDFRSLKLTMIALSQLVLGVILMLGGMKAWGIHLNYVNAFVATMILGVGIDYSIHLVHRMYMSDGAVDEGLLETGKAVVLAALTNIAGFGTLILGNYPALQSFGKVAVLGSLTCLFTALTLVPALMARREPAVKGNG
jgi:predicted RND superfamily exporter protein